MSDSSHTDSQEYTVKGMHCSHCVSAVEEEVGQIDGIDDVDVDLSSGSLTFTTNQPVDPATVRAAVEEAGYELAAG